MRKRKVTKNHNTALGRKMTFEDKLEYTYQELKNQEAKGYYIKTPPYQLLWLIGLNVKPPLYNSFLSNIIINGLFFGIIYSTIINFPVNINSISHYLLTIGLTGGLFGFIMSCVYKAKAIKYKVTKWEDIDKNASS